MRLLNPWRFVLACVLVTAGVPAASLFAQTTAPGDLGTVVIRVVPPTAEIFIDGERWVTPDNNAGLVVQLPTGRHAIEIRARGFRVFATVVDVRRGETTPVNVSLSDGRSTPTSGGEGAPAPPVRQTPITQTVSRWICDRAGFRFTELDHHTTAFAGVYGGYVFDRRLLVGAGGYWLTDDTHSVSDMAYGGAVVEWRLWSDRAVGFNLHGLAGYGQARLQHTVATIDAAEPAGSPRSVLRRLRRRGLFRRRARVPGRGAVRSPVSLKAGVGYRFTSVHDNDLGGASGSISIQFGR